MPADPPDPDDEPTDTRPAVADPPTAEARPVRAAETVDDDIPIDEGPDRSGSVDVAMSDTQLPAAGYTGPDRRQSASDPYSGPERRKRPTVQRAAERVEDLASRGVGKVGQGMDRFGAGVRRLGARVDKLPGAHRMKLGTGVIELGAGISEVGASLTDLPNVARTRRGRVLVRSLVVGFLLVFAWIAVIIYFQLRGGEKPDLRPRAEEIMVELRDGHYSKLFSESSPRFQEVSDYDQFERTMTEMKRTLGEFKEIAAVNDTVVSRGPGGLVARVDLQLDFEKGRTHATISLHRDGGSWKFLGIGVDLPENLIAQETSQDARAGRVKAPPEVRVAAERVLAMSRDLQSGTIWDEAAPLFQKSVSRADFLRIEDARREALGHYTRIIDETNSATQSATTPGGTGAWLTALVEYESPVETAIVYTSFGFSWIDNTWKLSSYVVVLPMPRAPRAPGQSAALPGDAAPAPAAAADASP